MHAFARGKDRGGRFIHSKWADVCFSAPTSVLEPLGLWTARYIFAAEAQSKGRANSRKSALLPRTLTPEIAAYHRLQLARISDILA